MAYLLLAIVLLATFGVALGIPRWRWPSPSLTVTEKRSDRRWSVATGVLIAIVLIIAGLVKDDGLGMTIALAVTAGPIFAALEWVWIRFWRSAGVLK